MSVWRRQGPRTAVVAALLVCVASMPAAGQADDVDVRLVHQATTVRPGEPLSFTIRVDGPLPTDGEVAVIVGAPLDPPVAGLDELRRTGELPTQTVAFVRRPLSEVPRGEAGQLLVEAPSRAPGEPGRDKVRLGDVGLYPVRIEVRDGDDDVLASMTTTVHRPPDVDQQVGPLDVALVLPVSSRPAGQPDGTVLVDPAVRQDLEHLADVLGQNTDVPLSVALPPEVVERLAGSAIAGDVDLVDRLATAVAGRQVLSTPYVTMDATTAARSRLADEFADQLARGEEALASVLPGTRPDRRAWLATEGLGPEGKELLRKLGVQLLVLADDVVIGPPVEPGGETDRVVRVETFGAEPLDGAIVPESRRDAFTTGDDPVLAAHLLAAELVANQLQAGGAPPGRGVVVVPPDDWALDPAFLATLLEVLAANPTLQPLTLEDWLTTVDRGGPDDAVLPVEVASPDLTTFADELNQTRWDIDSFSSMTTDQRALEEELDEVTRLAPADELRDDERRAYLDAVEAQLAGLRGAVLPLAEDRFTITSKSSRLPITIETSTDEPLTVKIRLESPKLVFPEGDQVVTVTRKATLDVPVEARSNGTFPVTARLLTPANDAPLTPPTQLTVTSTSYGGLGLAVTIAAVGVLATWWIVQVRQRRSERRADHAASADRHPTGAATTGR